MWWMLYIAIKTVDVDIDLVVPTPFASQERCEREVTYRVNRTKAYDGKATVEYSCRPIIQAKGWERDL